MAIHPLLRLILLVAATSALQLFDGGESLAVDSDAHSSAGASTSPRKKSHKKHTSQLKSDGKKHHRTHKFLKTVPKAKTAATPVVNLVAQHKPSDVGVANPTNITRKTSQSSKAFTTAGKKQTSPGNKTKKSKTVVHKKGSRNATALKRETSVKQDSAAAGPLSQRPAEKSAARKATQATRATRVENATVKAKPATIQTSSHVPSSSVVKQMTAAASTAKHDGLAVVGNFAQRAAQAVHSAKDGASKAIGVVAHGASMMADSATKAAEEAKHKAAGVRSSVTQIFHAPRPATGATQDTAGDDAMENTSADAAHGAGAQSAENIATAEKASSEQVISIADNATNTTSGIAEGEAPRVAHEKIVENKKAEVTDSEKETAVAGNDTHTTGIVETSEVPRTTNQSVAAKETPQVEDEKIIGNVPASEAPRKESERIIDVDVANEASHIEDELDDSEMAKLEHSTTSGSSVHRSSKQEGKPSLARNPSGTVSKLQEHIDGLKSHLQELIVEGQKKASKQRAEYEESLAVQHANTTEIRQANKQLADDIERISLENTGLWDRSQKLRNQAIQLRQELSDFRNNMSVAQEFIEVSIEHGSDNEKLQVLTELSRAEEAVRKQRAHENALKKIEVSKVAFVQFGDEGNALEHVNSLDIKFDELQREQKASLEALRGQYEKSWDEEGRVQGRLIEEQRDLQAQKAEQLARNDKLKSAVQHLENTTAQLQKMLHGLKHFSSGLGGQ